MGKLRKACANCIKYKLACEAKRPCSRCVLHQCDCIDVERKPRAARKPKRPRISLESPFTQPSTCSDTSGSAVVVKSELSPSFTQSSASSSPSQFIPELVLNDNEPQFAANNMTEQSSFLQQADSSLLPFSEYVFGNSSLLSSVLSIDQVMMKTEKPDDTMARSYFAFNATADDGFKKADDFFMSPVMSGMPSPQIISTPQPLLIAQKSNCIVLDCNKEFAQFLGYTSVTEFTTHIQKLEDVVVPDIIGFGKKSLDCFLNTKLDHFKRLGSLRGRDGLDRTVTFQVDVLEKLVMFTVAEVYDRRPINNSNNINNYAALNSRWPNTVVPDFMTAGAATIAGGSGSGSGGCDTANCLCKLYGGFAHPSPQPTLSLQPTLSPQQQLQFYQTLLQSPAMTMRL